MEQMEKTRTGAPLAIVPGLTSNILTGVSFSNRNMVIYFRIENSKRIQSNNGYR